MLDWSLERNRGKQIVTQKKKRVGAFPIVGIGRLDVVKDSSRVRPLAGAAILVAESEPLARESLSELFQEEGCRVLEASDCQSAIQHLNTTPNLDVVLLDLLMPFRTAVIQNARAKWPDALRLGMAIDPQFDPEHGKLGLHEYVLKPLLFDDLHALITRLMTGRLIK